MQQTGLAIVIAMCNICSMDNLVLRAKTKLNLTSEELASALGVHRITVWRWETKGHVSGPAKRFLEEMLAGKRNVQ